MYVLITYDVQTSDASGAKRLRKVARLCQNKGQRVQNSVFECSLCYAELLQLRADIDAVIDASVDSIRIYQLGRNYHSHIDTLGVDKSFDIEGELLV